ncbi:hypothetical protein EYZ11_007934 [Aspergillus tanneri]|uniref:Uncharacterized protein n=1 Tax=Aspergillus tanneri TaxID=1220188 RepID=A0A4V3UNV4_9EURO|nr:hypothetical protein EYZ11_007934 [Aspergillus tanneri]
MGLNMSVFAAFKEKDQEGRNLDIWPRFPIRDEDGSLVAPFEASIQGLLSGTESPKDAI